MSAMPEVSVEENIVRTICSDPIFIARIYHLIAFSGYLSKLPDHMTTVLGGAAFIMHAYMLNESNIERMHDSIRAIPRTSDIDIVVWYKNKLDKLYFLSRNATMIQMIKLMLDPSVQNYTAELLTRIKQLLPNIKPSIIDKIKIEVVNKDIRKEYEHMTTNISINFIINDKPFKVADVAIKNAIYSQHTEENRNLLPVTQNTTHTDEQNTFPMFVNDISSDVGKNKFVRIPTLERLIQQQQFGINAMRGRANISKYRARIEYLMQHSIRGLPASLPASLPAAPPRNSGRPPLAPRRGGKRHTHLKNKRHTRRKHTKRHTKRRHINRH